MEQRKIDIGRVIGFHGVKGELKVKILTDYPERFAAGRIMDLCLSSTKTVQVTIESVRHHKGNLLIKLSGVDSKNDALIYGGASFQIDEKDVRTLPKDAYYEFQMVGLKAYYLDGQYLGTITEILHYPQHDVYLVKGEEEMLLPALKKVIRRVDIDGGALWVDREMVSFLED